MQQSIVEHQILKPIFRRQIGWYCSIL